MSSCSVGSRQVGFQVQPSTRTVQLCTAAPTSGEGLLASGSGRNGPCRVSSTEVTCSKMTKGLALTAPLRLDRGVNVSQ